jgi:antitoxin (DNA-binding transcriptional repressor) of toxin-antitoxin stability system
MRSVNLAEAKVGLSALLAAVEAGEGVVISRLRRFHEFLQRDRPA